MAGYRTKVEDGEADKAQEDGKEDMEQLGVGVRRSR